VLSGRGLCDGLITRPEEYYRLWCVVVCDLETSIMRRPWPSGGLSRQTQTNNPRVNSVVSQYILSYYRILFNALQLILRCHSLYLKAAVRTVSVGRHSRIAPNKHFVHCTSNVCCWNWNLKRLSSDSLQCESYNFALTWSVNTPPRAQSNLTLYNLWTEMTKTLRFLFSLHDASNYLWAGAVPWWWAGCEWGRSGGGGGGTGSLVRRQVIKVGSKAWRWIY